MIDDRGWAVVSPAGSSDPDRLAPRNEAGRKIYKTHFGFAARGGRTRHTARDFLAVLLLIFISLIAGLVAKTNAGRRFIRWCENSFLGGLPQYQLVKSMAEGLARVESAESVQPALVSIEDGWQIAYLLEPLENGWVAVFLPQAPTPMSGNVMYLPADRVRPLDITMVQAMAIVKHIGVGSAEALRGADLKLPAGVAA